MSCFSDVERARAYFPRGLAQPEGAFRFSMDALLLAAYAARICPGWRNMADLGCGVGPVALGVLLLSDSLRDRAALGLEIAPELVAAGRVNAKMLGFNDVLSFEEADLTQFLAGSRAGAFDLITANPPYRLPGAGRLPPSPLRRAALFGSQENLAAFARAGAELLSPEGFFCLIFPSARAEELAKLLEGEGLSTGGRLPVVIKPGAEPALTLVAAAKNKDLAAPGQKPLVLYKEGGAGLSDEALEFCPFLGCNMKG